MGEMHLEDKDKIEYSEGLRGLFERLAHILKEAFEKLKNSLLASLSFFHSLKEEVEGEKCCSEAVKHDNTKMWPEPFQ